jgi:coproporphyrinogen III oxidase
MSIEKILPVTTSIRNRFVHYITELQQQIIIALEKTDGRGKFRKDQWTRPEGGGGLTCILEQGNVFEKAGVNISAVEGILPDSLKGTLGVEGRNFFACGLSLVLHPLNPFVPTVHANWRYFELYDDKGKVIDSWFGGGTDLTPYYIFPEDGRHFHTLLKKVLDEFDTALYPSFKKQCDEYFTNKHRGNEARGIGGIFYDFLRPTENRDAEWHFLFQCANGNAFLPSYLPLVEKRAALPFSGQHKEWQEFRRGRYAEFNLVHDRGTLFGLKTNGRTESILMSLPPTVRWKYDYHPLPGSREAELEEYLQPRNWIE